MSHSEQHRPAKPDVIAAKAAEWLARRDRGLSPEEQDEYLQWLTADPRHADELKRHAAAFQRMMRLYEWQPAQSTIPNPDLFAPRRRWKAHVWSLGLAAAALLVISATVVWSVRESSESAATASYLRLNESRVLPDGSIVELKDGSAIELEFSPAVRGVRLSGEAHFTVAKNSIPFVVRAGNFAVRAVGTAFNVRLDSNEIEVLVTEGKVHLNRSATESVAGSVSSQELLPPGNPPVHHIDPIGAADSHSPMSAELVAGQRATVPREGGERPRVRDVTPAEIERELAWQAPRLQFSDTPLAIAIAEFNQRNRSRLVLGDPALGSIPIGGTFRADNVDGFVRLLEVTLNIHGERRAGGKIILSRDR